MLTDWKERLWDYLDSQEDWTFSWSEHSCIAFAAGAVEAMTGEAYWKNELSDVKHLTKKECIEYIREYGGNLAGTVEKALKGIAVKREHPGMGDIVVVDLDGQETTGICWGRYCIFAGYHGLVARKPEKLISAWKIL